MTEITKGRKTDLGVWGEEDLIWGKGDKETEWRKVTVCLWESWERRV